jgi:ATP-dependent DNA helicase RecG
MTLKVVDKLKKILRLEAERHEDKAVVGGLASYARTWEREAGAVYGPEASGWVDEVTQRLRTYTELPDRSSRRKALAALREVISRGPNQTGTEKKDKPSRKQKTAQRESPPPAASKARETLDSPITVLHGIGPKRAERMARLGVRTIRDMLTFLPRRYNDYSELKPINRLSYGEEVTVIARVRQAKARRPKGGPSLFRATLSDGTGSVEVTWFNQSYLANKIKPGDQIVISGEVDEYLGRLCFKSPEWEPLREDLLHTNRIVPVYPLTEGMSGRWLRRLMKRTVTYWVRRLPDYLPSSVQQAEGLLDLETALLQAHFPSSMELLHRARRRLAFDELFVLQLALLKVRREWRSDPGQPITVREDVLQAYLGSLPYELTEAQRRSLQQILDDLRSEEPMTRLLQGDVGSGKTVVAAGAIDVAAAAGGQAALMAPTEILAEQHYRTVSRLLSGVEDGGLTVALLTGSVTGEAREAAYAGLADGTIDVVVGTHALIQEDVSFEKLALAVVDEQHRFGVRQRGALREKGYNPHLLVMTATPIPRSLQLTVWGHLDVSVIDEMPPGREPVVTRLILPTERERAYGFVRSQVEKGRQAFVICPLVEESDEVEARAAVQEYERLQEDVFPELALGLLHGRMSGDEKDATMSLFAAGELDILVATSVIEVGIDVPNASVMLIEGAERFGLAQLHQFRGRVGRGEHASYCLLISDSSSDRARERLTAVEATNDGFALAQKDLEMRGPGEFLGTRQSGLSEAVMAMSLADVTDLRLVEQAREAARRFFHTDPELANPAHRLLSRRVERLLDKGGEIS